MTLSRFLENFQRKNERPSPVTPAGVKSKMQLSRAFLKRKLDEYKMLKMEIEELQREVGPDKTLSD